MMMLCKFFYTHVYHSLITNYAHAQAHAVTALSCKVITIPTPLEIDLYISQFVYIYS